MRLRKRNSERQPFPNDTAAHIREIRDLSRELSSQALAILPFQVFLSAVLAATMSRGHLDGIPALISVAFLGISFCMTTMTLSRVHKQPAWNAPDIDRFLKHEAKRVSEKGRVLQGSAWSLLVAAVAVAITAFTSISY
jgi:hypothetical protein